MNRSRHSRKIWSLILGSLLTFSIMFSFRVHGHNGISLGASTSTAPTIDGTIIPGEWAAAAFTSFALGTHSGQVYVMNDRTNLYVAVSIGDESPGNDQVDFRFDNAHNGVWPDATPGEDGIYFAGVPITFSDVVSKPGPNGVAVAWRDVDVGGTSDGAGATAVSTTENMYEFRHPLCSGDPNDFCLSLGQTVGFSIEYCPDYSCPIMDRVWPAFDPSKWADIGVHGSYTVSLLPTTLTVEQGSFASTTVTVSASNFLGSPVSLGVTGAPTGITPTLSPSTVAPTAGGSATAVLSVSVGANVPVGRYQLNIISTSGSEAYSRAVTLVVTESRPPNTLGSLLLGGIVAAGAVGSFALFRRSKKKTILPAALLALFRRKKLPSGQAASEPSVAEQTETSWRKSSSLEAASESPVSSKPKGRFSELKAPFRLPKPLITHMMPVSMIAVGLVLVIAAIRILIGDLAAFFAALFVPGLLLIGIGGAVLLLQLYRRPVGMKRFCMHCGFQISSVELACGRCHRQPPSGVDSKACPNCACVIPTLAQFCRDCGARQQA